MAISAVDIRVGNQSPEAACATAKLRVDGVSLQFPSNDGKPVEVLNNISVSIAEGEFCTIVGPSGCGKSTLLSVIAGLLKPSAGVCYLDAKATTLGDPSVGYMFQSDTLLPWATALDNVRLPRSRGSIWPRPLCSLRAFSRRSRRSS